MPSAPEQTPRRGRPPKAASEPTSRITSDPRQNTEPEITVLRPPMNDMEEVRGSSIQQFMEQVKAARDVKPVEYVPPQPSARQQSQTEMEIAAGRARTKYFEEQAANRPRVERDKSEGSVTPVFRPGDHVPKL